MKIKEFFTHSKAPAIFTALMIGGVSLTAIHTIPNPPIFQNTDNFVFFADQSLSFEENATISSGDLGTNGNLDIGKDGAINSNLFADKITLDKNTTINGNATFNKLKNQGEIFGTKTTPVSLPIANLPAILSFVIGTQDQTIQGIATLPAGNYKNITLQKDSTLTLSGGTYNLNALELQEHSTLVFIAPTTLNIQTKLKGENDVSIFNGTGAKFDDLHINIRNEQKNNGTIEQDNETDSVSFGKNSFLNFTLFAPNASVTIGKDSVLRGRVLARKIRVGKGFVGSRDESVSVTPSAKDIVVTEEGERFVVNQIIIQLTPEGTLADINTITTSIGGRVVGTIPSIHLYQIVVQTKTEAELGARIQQLLSSGNPVIKKVSKNIFVNLVQ